MEAPGGREGPELGHLIKQLAINEAREELQRLDHIPKLLNKVQKRLTDIAFSQLLGLQEASLFEIQFCT